jgi:hypothetical protein
MSGTDEGEKQLIDAGFLDQTHVGAEVSYGPGMMFTGILEQVRQMDEPWLVRYGDSNELREMPSPPRVYIRTADGRASTLAADEIVAVQILVQQEKGEA